ncbi:CLUMA_CG001434, isoform A [Clunio marinus]|uniref:CLUMA_CG001434, isoform A n=1 Tax=Clunio marinus TaxID=568069 RepID=A0A1J1HMF5_9DIPT|nr:CLUMA_CG001434, isoform A [Clunio marinus]
MLEGSERTRILLLLACLNIVNKIVNGQESTFNSLREIIKGKQKQKSESQHKSFTSGEQVVAIAKATIQGNKREIVARSNTVWSAVDDNDTKIDLLLVSSEVNVYTELARLKSYRKYMHSIAKASNKHTMTVGRSSIGLEWIEGKRVQIYWSWRFTRECLTVTTTAAAATAA